MSVFTTFVNLASEQIAKWGGDAVILRNGTTSYPVRALVIEYSPAEKAGSTGGGAGLIQSTDQKVMVAAKGLPIIPDGEQDVFVSFDSFLQVTTTYRIVTVKRLFPGGEDIFHELQIRR